MRRPQPSPLFPYTTLFRSIVTRVDPLKGFYPAEAYHQDFLVRNPTYPYIVINDLKKIANLKRLLPDQYRERSEEHTSELQSHVNLVCRLLLEKKNKEWRYV